MRKKIYLSFIFLIICTASCSHTNKHKTVPTTTSIIKRITTTTIPQLTTTTAPVVITTTTIPQAYNSIPPAQITTQAQRQAEQASQAQDPAVQHLPYSSPTMYIQLGGVNGNGQIVLLVDSTLDLTQTQASYQAWLRSYNDPGTAYYVNYLPNQSNVP